MLWFTVVLSVLYICVNGHPSLQQNLCNDLCEHSTYDYSPDDCWVMCDIMLSRSQTPLQNLHEEELKEPLDKDSKRYKSTFVRIGRNFLPWWYNQPSRRKSSFVRIGRSVEEGDVKGSFAKLGKNHPGFADHFMNNQQDVLNSLNGGEFGLDHESEFDGGSQFDKKASSFVRIGRGSAFVRIGKSADGATHLKPDETTHDDSDKISSSFVRIGKSGQPLMIPEKRAFEISDYDQDKDGLKNTPERRASSFIRIGKPAPMIPESSVDGQNFDGNSNPYMAPSPDNKRFSSFVRIGKRPSAFVRIGKSDPKVSMDSDKRVSSFVRIGKWYGDAADLREKIAENIENLPNEKKKLSNFIRIGKSQMDDQKE